MLEKNKKIYVYKDKHGDFYFSNEKRDFGDCGYIDVIDDDNIKENIAWFFYKNINMLFSDGKIDTYFKEKILDVYFITKEEIEHFIKNIIFNLEFEKDILDDTIKDLKEFRIKLKEE